MSKYLVVDDNDFSLLFTEELIRQAADDKDIDIVTINDGKEAVKIFENSKPEEFSAVFVDIIMPEKDGIMILHEIRSMNRSDTKSVPIIIVSAVSKDNSMIGPEEKALITHYIQKPLSEEKFRNVLQKIEEQG